MLLLSKRREKPVQIKEIQMGKKKKAWLFWKNKQFHFVKRTGYKILDLVEKV